MPDEIDEEIRKVLREPLNAMPGIIRSGLFKPGASASYRLGWTGLAIKLLNEFATPEVSVILREAIPELEKIRNEHRSERLRSTAAEYLLFIANKMA
jgi:hypothetical protein